MVSTVTFLKLQYSIKLGLLTIMLSSYVILMKTVFSSVFATPTSCGISLFDKNDNCMQLETKVFVLLGLYFFIVVHHSRLVSNFVQLPFFAPLLISFLISPLIFRLSEHLGWTFSGNSKLNAKSRTCVRFDTTTLSYSPTFCPTT